MIFAADPTDLISGYTSFTGNGPGGLRAMPLGMLAPRSGAPVRRNRFRHCGTTGTGILGVDAALISLAKISSS